MQGSLEWLTEAVIKNIAELILIGLFGVMTYYTKSMYNQWTSRAEVLDQLDRLVNGIDGNNHFEGLIEVIEGHDEELDEHHAKIRELQMHQKHTQEKQNEIEERINRLKEKKANREELHRLEDEVND